MNANRSSNPWLATAVVVVVIALVAARPLVAQPLITCQPQSQTNVVGAMLTLLACATGTPPLAYQWRKGGVNVVGETNATFVATNLQPSHAGNYVVVITNLSGAVTSDVALVRVLVPPSITSQPSSQTAEAGETATFSVVAMGTAPIRYQWRLDDQVIPSHTNASLLLTNLQLADAGNYSVVATNAAGAITSMTASLTVILPQFTRITTGHIVNDGAHSIGCIWGDYDQDGWLDLFVSNADGQANLLYRNLGNGTFERITNGPVITDTGDWRGVSWADYDNDGDLDLFVTSTDANGFATRNLLYRNNGDGTFARLASSEAGPVVGPYGGSEGCVWADYDQDGFLDVFVARYGSDLLFHGNDDGRFTQITNSPLVQDNRNGYGAGWGDYDNDGRPDLFVVNHVGLNNLLYHNLGGGLFEQVSVGAPGNEGGHSYGPAWGDFNNDGFLDLFVANGFGGDAANNFLYRNNGDGTFTKITNSPVFLDRAQSPECAWGDYDNDGNLDLFVTRGNDSSPGSETNFLYRGHSDGTFTRVKTGAIVRDAGLSVGCDWGDYDNDGFLDLFVARGAHTSQNNLLYRNNGNSNAWIKIRPVGTVSNRSGIGAKVRVKTVGEGVPHCQLREISTGHGFGGSGLIAHFGLGMATNIDAVRIEWPSGTVQELRNVTAKQLLTVIEPPRLQVTGTAEFRFRSWTAMRFAVEASTNLSTWTPLSTITNTAGTVSFADLEAASYAQRFYRVLPLDR